MAQLKDTHADFRTAVLNIALAFDQQGRGARRPGDSLDMTIERPNEIDGIGIDSTKNELVLLISDHLNWEDEASHIASLEGKLGGHINFINSGQHFEALPQAKGMPVRIKLIHEHEPTNSARQILRAVETQLKEMNIFFSHESLPASY